MKITRCRTNHMVNPLGYKMDHPVLSWVADTDGDAQNPAGTEPVLYRIKVSKEEQMEVVLFDSGYDETIPSAGYRLPVETEARTRYYWRVYAKRGQEETVSDVNWFETAKQEEDWQADWISTETEHQRHPLFFRSIRTQGEVKTVRLYICGLGLYEAYWNGRKIGSEYLTPYCSNYHQWIQYQTYDMTEMVQEEPQAELSVLLADGWYKGRFTYERGRDAGFYGDRRMMIAELHVVYADGREEIFCTGEDWKVRESSITFSNIYDGEQMDASLPDTEPVGVCKCEAPKGALTARLSLPVTVYKELQVTELTVPNGEKVFDIGQNMTGIFRMKIDVPAGQTVQIQFGEELQDGNFYRENLRTAKAEYIYVSDGTPREIRPHFTFYGGRYIRVTGAPEVKAEDICVLVLTSELEETGSISTGHPLVNQLISNIEWSRRGNFVDVPTDCPQRDERMGWTGDAQIFCPTACYQTDAYAFYRKYLYDIWTEQQTKQGMVPNVVPSFGLQGYSPVWGDAAVIIPWTLYQFAGDCTILEEQYPSMKAWVDFMQAQDGDDCGWRKVSCFGDWLALDRVAVREGDCDGATDKDFVADVFYMYSAELLAKTARILERAEDAEEYGNLAETLRNRIKEEFYSANGRCCVNTQTGLLLTLRHRLADTERTKAALRRKLESNLNRLDTGFIGTALICSVLAENEMPDLAEKLFFDDYHRNYPERIIGFSEYGADANIRFQTSHPEKGDYTEQYQALYHEHLLKCIEERPYLWATHVWNLFDFAADGRDEGGAHGRNQKGLVSFDRKTKKDAFYLYKAAWNHDEPFVHLCGGRYTDRAEEETEIKVYSNQARVTLFVDGTEYSTQESERIFRFRIPVSGEHQIRAIARRTEDGQEQILCSDEIRIRKTAEPNPDYIFQKQSVVNWFDAESFQTDCFSVKDTFGEVMAHPQASRILQGIMAKARASRGDVAASTEGNAVLQKMMAGMTIESLLKQAGEAVGPEQVKAVNAALQKIKK